MKPLAGVLATAAVHAAGHSAAALWEAAQSGRCALRANRLQWCDLDCWIGDVPAVEGSALPPDLAQWDSRNNRLAWLALRDGAFRDAVATAAARYGASRVGIVLGTSTSGIRSTEEAYKERREEGAWPDAFHYRKMHSLEATARFVARVLRVDGPAIVVSTACSSSAKAFLTAARWMQAGVVDAA
ncbi:MAG TPA: beta-ketoacyl synthase N-terminal-like domain-containing protein, partial [Ramlibacter sp.]